jgi:5-methyltetrahydrofolate--homocysteine methyltransferase
VNFKNWLVDHSNPLLFDGAMGTQLMQHGIKAGQIPDLLNLTNPDIVQKVLSSYYQAGADLVQSCTFSSNLLNLKSHELSEKLVEINSQALKNIQSVRMEGKLVVGDIGPSGQFRPPVGNVTEEDWREGFLKQVEVLEPGVDLWHIETISDLQEMVAAIESIQQISNKPIIASMTYRKTKKRGYFTIMGDSVESCVNTLEDLNVDVIGTNCTLGSHQMIDLAKTLVDMTSKPVSVKPNAGQPRLEGGTTIYDQTVDDFVSDIEQMLDSGAKIVGGCCGTTPSHISRLRTLIDNHK